MLKMVRLLVVVNVVSACAERGEIQYGTPSPGAKVQKIWVAKFRTSLEPEPGQLSPPRPTKLTFEMNEVSVPKGHQTGKIEWPRNTPDAETDFVTLSTQEFPNIGSFAANVAKADKLRTGGTVLFVHGYNYTHGEAVYQLAQIVHDFETPSPSVLFSWPSAGEPAGYVYDRDSVLIARDQLEQVIIGLTRQPGRKLVIMGHSMGNFLVMETLRQIEISGSVNIGAKIDALFMISPDIDGELFYTQAARLKRLPDPSVIVAVDQDKALRLSALLTGRTNRLGSQTDRKAVGNLPISVVNASNLAAGGSNHSIALTSPAAIAIIKNLEVTALPGETKVPPLLILGGPLGLGG